MKEERLKKYMCEAITKLEDKDRLHEEILRTQSQLLKLVDKCPNEKDKNLIRGMIIAIMDIEFKTVAEIKAITETMEDLVSGNFPEGEEEYNGYQIVVYDSKTAEVYSFCGGSYCILEYKGDSAEDCKAFIDRKVAEQTKQKAKQ